MKNDLSFKLVATIIFVGVLIALAGPSSGTVTTAQAGIDPNASSSHTE